MQFWSSKIESAVNEIFWVPSVCYHLVIWYALCSHFGATSVFATITKSIRYDQKQLEWPKTEIWAAKTSSKIVFTSSIDCQKDNSYKLYFKYVSKDLRMWLLRCRLYRILCPLIIHRCKLSYKGKHYDIAKMFWS